MTEIESSEVWRGPPKPVVDFHTGALMFNVGKILQTPEVVRVFVGSFWDEPLVHAEYEKVFRKDRAALIRVEIKLQNSRARSHRSRFG